jgi:hypothetical protein
VGFGGSTGAGPDPALVDGSSVSVMANATITSQPGCPSGHTCQAVTANRASQSHYGGACPPSFGNSPPNLLEFNSVSGPAPQHLVSSGPKSAIRLSLVVFCRPESGTASGTCARRATPRLVVPLADPQLERPPCNDRSAAISQRWRHLAASGGPGLSEGEPFWRGGPRRE